ncbi:hypothetical protein Lal_00033624 [Lupinus albus]|nr:hypothetical protein Lal_00033624 [Lupinus albus]
MLTIREGILIKWPIKNLKVIYGIASSLTRFLAYGILVSMVIDHLEIDTSDLEFIVTNSREHPISDKLIYKMGIYKYGESWMYQEDHNTTVDYEFYDEEGNENKIEPDPDQPQA